MKQKFILFFLISLLINAPFIKKPVHRFLVKTVYLPSTLLVNFLNDIKTVKAERDSLSFELIHLKQEFFQKLEEIKDTISPGHRTDLIKCIIISFEPLGIPEKIFVEVPHKLSKNNYLAVDIRGNLAGKSINSEGKYANIITIFSPEFRIGIKNVRNRVMGIFYGGTSPEVRFIPADVTFKKGDTLITSGIGKYRVYGIPVGIVDTVETDMNNPLFQKCKVIPFFEPYRENIIFLKKGR